MKPWQIAETVEQAISIVLDEKTECQLEWYSLGKTRDDFLEHPKTKNINPIELGVFITGNIEEPKGRFAFMPLDWIHHEIRLDRSSAHPRLATNHQ